MMKNKGIHSNKSFNQWLKYLSADRVTLRLVKPEYFINKFSKN